ncbi:hypothetical protein ABMA09_14030 [Erwinia rhapontici]|uniref:hypothetical protein n=1 Tax=Erwinia rhapontici TaxID=55212 RepID=UPI003D3610BB
MNKKISELDNADALTGSELLAVSQETSEGDLKSRKLTLDKIKEFIPPGKPGVGISEITIETERVGIA